MIVRIIGEGQFEVSQDELGELEHLDEALADAVDTADGEKYRQLLSALVGALHKIGRPVPAGYIGPSDVVLPGPHTSLEEVRELLREEGLTRV